MIKGLKVAMIVWSAIGILTGLVLIFAPEQFVSMSGFDKGPAYVSYFLALVGIAWTLPGIFVIIAARDPLKHIMWLQMAIFWSILDALAGLFFIIRGNITFSQMGSTVIIDTVFTVIFLALYPWRKAHTD